MKKPNQSKRAFAPEHVTQTLFIRVPQPWLDFIASLALKSGETRETTALNLIIRSLQELPNAPQN